MKHHTEIAEFGKLLQARRKHVRLTQEGLARRVAVSPILISYYERGRRTPRYETALKIADALRLEGNDKEQFLGSLEFPVEDSPNASEVLDELVRIFSNSRITPTLKDKLAAELQGVLNNWREMQKKDVRWGVIPVAGWQARLLAPYATLHMIERVLVEAAHAGIEHAVVVVAPSQEHALSESLLDRNRPLKIRVAVQQDQFGLGHAILAAQRCLPSNEPFAVILPDDDLEESCLTAMVAAYSKDKSCIIAVRQVKRSDEGCYGIACVYDQQENPCRIQELEEKPLGKLPSSSLAIAGRYIVTPDIFKALEATKPTANGDIEFTDAIRRLSHTQPIYGYLYTGMADNLSPSRRELERMIMSRKRRDGRARQASRG
jgi:UTP--glucose-1-phosphate uridylyltransferase